MPKFKGTVYLSTKMFAEQEFGADGLDSILGQLPEVTRAELADVSAMDWCDTAPVMAFHGAMQELYGTPLRDVCEDAGRFSVRWNMNTILRVFMRFTSPHWIVGKAGSVWDRYHDTGSWHFEPAEPNHIQGRLNDFAVTDPLFFRRLCGWLAGLCELTGGKNTVIRHQLDGTCHSFSGTWQ